MIRQSLLDGLTKILILAVVIRMSAEEEGPGLLSEFAASRDIGERETYIRVTTILVEPYVKLKDNRHNNRTTDHAQYEGYIVDLMDEITKVFGLKYRLYPLDDGRYGNKYKDGTWDGMIGELINKNADLAAAPMFITQARSDVVDFTRPFLRVQATVLLKRPPTGKPAPIQSVEDLVRHSHIEFGTQNIGMIKGAFRTSNHSLYQKMWHEMKNSEPSVFTASNEAGIRRVRESIGKYAFILPTTIGDYIARKDPCDLITVDSFLMNRGFGLATPKHSALLRQLNKTLDALEANGFLKKIYEKWWIKKNDCNGIHSSKIYSLTTKGGASHYVPHVFVSFFAILLAYFTVR